MPADYYAGDQALYVEALKGQLAIFGTDCKMPKGGPETVLKIDQDFVASMKGKTADSPRVTPTSSPITRNSPGSVASAGRR